VSSGDRGEVLGLRGAADELPPMPRPAPLQRLDELLHLHLLRAPFDGEPADRVELETVREPPRGLLADHDRPGRGERLEAGGDVGRVPEGDGLLVDVSDDPHRGRAGVDPHAHVELLDASCALDVARVVANDL
jgi:hypothetical protein